MRRMKEPQKSQSKIIQQVQHNNCIWFLSFHPFFTINCFPNWKTFIAHQSFLINLPQNNFDQLIIFFRVGITGDKINSGNSLLNFSDILDWVANNSIFKQKSKARAGSEDLENRQLAIIKSNLGLSFRHFSLSTLVIYHWQARLKISYIGTFWDTFMNNIRFQEIIKQSQLMKPQYGEVMFQK
ncbi:unnamed protein product [Paramecium primaurelia]|uniref:Uncharacterized protein n=1 Tax=Paramecium primaurelia TaxID=5886 RepID=A0A8S1QM48_PARPR|nr:unnamed protein product [Paramecium primaurelia]